MRSAPHDPIARALKYFAVDASGCWSWTSKLDQDGYGLFWFKGKRRRAHRVVYELVHARPIPEGLVTDHLCRNRRCVNPRHIELTTPEENVARRARCHCGFCVACRRNAYMRRWSQARKQVA